MRMRAQIVFVMLGLSASSARADQHHDMMMMDSDAMGSASSSAPSVDASVQLVAASYSTLTYVGDYEGAIASIGVAKDRYMLGASLGTYRIYLNGLEQYGIGDVMVHGSATIIRAGEAQAGVMMMVSAPTGDEKVGLGMGHTMLMPALFGAWSHDHLTLAASAGYSRAIAQMEAGHDHGVWPLVEPMNMSEITWSASGDYAFPRGIHFGVASRGGHPVGNIIGHERVIGASRIGWVAGRVDTSVEVQAGIVGDPFTVRGLVESALHF